MFAVRHFGNHYGSITLGNTPNKFIASNFVEKTCGEELLTLQKAEITHKLL